MKINDLKNGSNKGTLLLKKTIKSEDEDDKKEMAV